jgi:hypothetical protein
MSLFVHERAMLSLQLEEYTARKFPKSLFRE